MAIWYSYPHNNLQKLQNFMTKFTIRVCHILGCFPYKWNSSQENYSLGTKLQLVLSVISIMFAIITSFTSLYTYQSYIFGASMVSNLDVILNVLSVTQFFISIVITCLTALFNRVRAMNLFNRVLYLKKHVLKLNTDPFSDSKLFKIILFRCCTGAVLIFSITFLADEATSNLIHGHSIWILKFLMFFVHYTWYTTAVTSLLCSSLFAAHLIRVITAELKDIIKKLRWLRKTDQIKPGQMMFELCKLSDRIDNLSFCHLEVIKFVQLITSLTQIAILGVSCNVFTSIITNTGNIYVRLFSKDVIISEFRLTEIKIYFAYIWFALNEVYLMNYGPQKFLKRVLKLQKLVGNVSMFMEKSDNHVNKSVSIDA